MRLFVAALSAITTLSVSGLNAQSFDLDNLARDVDEHRRKWMLPAVGVAIVTSESTQVIEVTGYRKLTASVTATKEDLWHIGSCGKAMTATMIARLVQAGSLKWEQTLEETFPELKNGLKDATKSITLVQLLSHTSGLQANFAVENYTDESDLVAARYRVVQEAISSGFTRKPGTFHYSNWGYTIAAAVAEKVTGKSWESLMKEEVFVPLEMTSAGFGGTGTVGMIDQPWPHNLLGFPLGSNGPQMDNVPTMGPAGTIHMNLADWGKFVSEHLRGGRGKSSYLKPEIYDVLHKPIADDYGLGWGVLQRDWGGRVLSHSGDNTMNHAVVWASPEKNFAVLVVTNRTGAEKAVDSFCGKLIQAWLAKQKP
ncbi:MAG: beta-lactamase family protein [Pirellula sp.]|jgi:CubicO group peptidase (beta-lactamase class C family)|nr:beta-lactamase family protein [Pirellula sp.]